VTKYDVVDAAAYRRDVVGQLAKAVKEAGLKFGVYYSLEDWYYEQTTSNGGVDEYRENFVKPQLRELAENYNTDLILLDKGELLSWTNDNTNDVVSFLRGLKSSLIIGITDEKLSADYRSSREITMNGDELGIPMSDSWGCKHNDMSWKKSRELVALMIKANAGGGNFMVGVGPKHFGTLAPESIFRLAEIGEWMKQNAEAVVATLPFDSQDATAAYRARSKGFQAYKS
jgi:alpha-L-fucosidase